MRKPSSMDEYIEAGAYYRLYKTIASKCSIKIPKLVHGFASDTDKFMKVSEKVYSLETKTKLEHKLLTDHPNLGMEFTSVFYGDLTVDDRNELDRKVVEKAKEIANELFRKETEKCQTK